MEKTKFFEELKETLELDGEINEDTSICLSSLAILSLIVFIDENFGKQIKAAELKNVGVVNDIIILIGTENIEN
jgi:acyl carrier protein